MKKYNLITFFFFLVSSISSEGWSQESIKDELQLVLEQIQDQIKEKQNAPEKTPLIIAIGGCPGVGKSTLSRLVQAELSELGIISAIISLDHYGLSQEERKQFASELDSRRIQWNKLHNTLTEICAGENKITKPVINQLTKETSQDTLDLQNVTCILFEGSYTLSDFAPMNFLQYADLAIYLESSLDNIYDWKWQRELKKSSPRSAQAFFNHMMEILKDFAFHVYPTRKNADYIIHIDFFHHYSVTDSEAVKRRPEPDFTLFRLEALTY